MWQGHLQPSGANRPDPPGQKQKAMPRGLPAFVFRAPQGEAGLGPKYPLKYLQI